MAEDVLNLSDEDGVFLVRLARETIENFVRTGKMGHPPKDVSPRLKEKGGVFVTINKLVCGGKHLRGCIGYPLPYFPLAEATMKSAVEATRDPRFPPLREDELDGIVVEVTVLSVPELLKVKDPREYVEKVKVGRDGLLVARGPFKGLLLPQVPVEWNWDAETFLCECCMKAGLPPDAWLDRDTEVYVFRGVIFEEEEPRGKIVRKELSAERV
ncbi:MAG: TIGR00296 family protein [Candidatus Freyarchaeota archaeon]|nr:TIGR00296 family protein [Candidatus Jordarchaeia archaeon]